MALREKLVLLFYTLFNIISNQFIALYSDEAYYWFWSKNLELSYFDHPPMVAYLIHIATVFGDDPIFVRLPSALLVSATAYIVYKMGKKIFDEKAAIYTYYIFLSSFLVLVASTLITPDIPLMFFWSLSLYSAYIYIEEDNKKYALLLGLSAGLMMLSKYTGILPLFTLLVYILLYKRALFKDKYLYLAMLIALLVFMPVLYWNYQHDFISFSFQLQHGIESKEKVFLAKDFFTFVGLQFALFHPFYLLPLFYFIIRDKNRFEKKKVFLLLPFLFVFFFFSYNAAFKHANYQWAAGAYISATVLLGYYLSKYNYKKLLAAGVILSVFILIIFKTPAGNYIPTIVKMKSRLGKINNFKTEIEALNIDLDEYDYVLIDNYHGAEVAYYFRKTKKVLILGYARFSQFNIWQHDRQNINLNFPVAPLPKLGKCIYIGRKFVITMFILKKLFGNEKVIAHFKKSVANRYLEYYIVEYEN